MGARVTDQGKPMLEELAARWVVAFSMVMIGVFSLISFFPSPTELPGYARFLPVNVSSDAPAGVPSEVFSQAVPGREREPTDVATATVTVHSANCRSGPGPRHDRTTILYQNQEVEILGKNADPNNRWWYVKIPNLSGNCWLWGMTARVNGSESNIPVLP